MKTLFFIFVGGGTGSVLRYAASMLWKHLSLHPRLEGTVFPWPTFIVNILGCALISLFYQYSDRWGLSQETRLMLTTGFCGGFTTFSTFSYEGMNLLRQGYYLTYATYLLFSIILGLLVAFAIREL